MTPQQVANDIKTRMAIALSGKYVKQALANLESSGTLTPEIRKAILDAFNDYKRELERLLLGA